MSPGLRRTALLCTPAVGPGRLCSRAGGGHAVLRGSAAPAAGNCGPRNACLHQGACVSVDVVLEGEGTPPVGLVGRSCRRGESWASLLKGITSRYATAMSAATAYGWGPPPTTTVTSCWPGT